MIYKFLSSFFLMILFFSQADAQNVAVNEAFNVNVKAEQNQGVKINFDIVNNAYLYKDNLKISLYTKNGDQNLMHLLNLPTSVKRENSEIYDGKFSIFVPFGLIMSMGADLAKFKLILNYTGCSLFGYCYPPQQDIITVVKAPTGYNIKQQKAALEFGNNEFKNDDISNVSEQQKIANSIKTENLVLTLITFFGYGLILSLTPCILPMIPILSSIIVLKAAKKIDKIDQVDANSQKSTSYILSKPENIKGGFAISLIYVFGMAAAYSIIGALVTIFSSSIQGILQIPWVILLFAIIFVFLAFSMFGFYDIQMPRKFQSILSDKSGKLGGIVGVFIMGLASALIVGPCVAAPLAGALLYIASTKDIFLGAFALFVMGFGMGVPLLVIGFGSQKIIPKPGSWMNEIKYFFGFVLLGMAIWMASRVIGDNFALGLYGVLGIFFAIFNKAFQKIEDNGFLKFRKSIAIVVFIYSVALIVGFASGAKDFFKPLANFAPSISKTEVGQVKEELKFTKILNLDDLKRFIKNAKNPVMIDFWASWCENCKKLDNVTFKDISVINKLKNFELVKIDVTNENVDNQKLMEKFNVFGPPSIVFFKDGKELTSKQISGYVNAKEFLDKTSEI